MNKKYDFNEILKEYNEKHKKIFKLDKKIGNATITQYSKNNLFKVSYTCTDSLLPNTSITTSLEELLHYYVSKSISVLSMIAIILHKEEGSLGLKIGILPPNKIRYAYLCSNYYSQNIGQLGKSCMRDKEMQKSLNFYVKNNVRIVVLMDNNHKIHARALLWDNVKSTRRKTPFTYLDRAYANSEHHTCLFYELAVENEWEYYSSTSAGEACNGYYKDDIDITNMCYFPWADTFRYLYHKDNLVSSSLIPSKVKYNDDYISLCIITNGGYFPSLDLNRVQEAISGYYISKKDATFIKRYDGFVLKKNIADINGDYYSVFDNKITKTVVDGYVLKENSVVEVLTNDTIDKNKATYSAKYTGHVHESNVVYIRDELYHKLDANIICFDNEWYHISQCFVNYDRKDMNKELTIQTCYTHLPENYIPYWRATKVGDSQSKYPTISRVGVPIPKKHAIIMYNLVYNPIVNRLEHQVVYCTSKNKSIQLTTGELIVSSDDNRRHLKKFNNKWYIKQEFKPPNKNQLTLF